MTAAEPQKPKYDWVQTFANKEKDFTGWDENIMFGRVYKHHLGLWWWFLNGDGLGSADGHEDSARKAILNLEAEYDRIKALLIADGRFDKIPRRPRDKQGF